MALITEARTSPGVITTLWQRKDHFGSTTTLLDAGGLLSFTCKSYDWWGKRRHVTGEDVPLIQDPFNLQNSTAAATC